MGPPDRLCAVYHRGMDDLSFRWTALHEQLTSVLTEDEFDQRTIENTRDLLHVCRLRGVLPSSLVKGYWPTVCLDWPGWQIEVFPDHYELYHFREDGGTDIIDFDRQLGELVPERMLDQLPPKA